jgi:uncharacterized membrane protein YhaH (DUF805 family)
MPIAIVAMAVYGMKEMNAIPIARRLLTWKETNMSVTDLVLLAQLIAAICVTANNVHELGKRKGWW